MSNLFSQLGINLPMLVAQAVNFAVLLAVLTIFVYRPLLRVMEERRKKIELGVRGGELAAEKVAQAEAEARTMVQEAQRSGVEIVGQAEKQATIKEKEIITDARVAGERILVEAEARGKRQAAEELAKLSRAAADVVRAALAQAVNEKPEKVDQLLVERAADIIRAKI